MTKKLLMLTCASGALALWGGASHAATAAAAAADTDNTSGATSVTELVVTAEKRETSLQKVPVAVSVFTGAQRDTIGINTVADVTNFAPGFTYDPANVHAFIRGVGRQSVNVTDDQRVANYEDEFYVYSPYGLDKSSLFLSQVQIERGPQNVGGRNAAAGSIDMISVRPTDTPYAELRATVGNFQTYDIEGAASGQIAPGLDVRIAGFDKNQNEGYYTNLIGRSEGNVIHEWYIEGQVDWKPNDKFEFWARTFFEGWNGRGDAGSRVGFYNGNWDETALTDGNAYVGGGLFVNPNYGYAAAVGGNPAAHAAAVAAGVDVVPTSVTFFNPSIRDNPSQSNPNVFAAENPRNVKLSNYDDFNYIATYHADSFDIKYTGGVQGYNYYLNDPGDGPGENSNVQSFTLPFTNIPGVTPPGATALTIFPQVQANYVEDDWWTAHDLTFQSTNDSPFQWTFGGFGFYQHYNQPYQVTDANQPQLTNPICSGAGLCGIASGAPSNPNDQIGYFDYKFNVESLAGYGELSYKLNDQWKVTGDLRYNSDHKWGVENSRYLYFGNAIIDGYSPFYGSFTPSEDITYAQTCFTGNGVNNVASASCRSGPLASGVTSIGKILPNGYAQRNLGITSDALTGGGEIQFTPTPDIFTYFRYGRGYESPSFNAGQNIGNPVVKPEYLDSYEIGYKQTIGKALLVDLAAYYYNYEGLQVPVSITNGGVTQSQFINVPKALSEGIEAEAYWTPVTDLLVTLSYSYDHTEVLTGCSGTLSAGGSLTPAAGSLCVQDTNDPAAVAPGAQPFPGQTFIAGAQSRFQSVKGAPLPDAPENKFAVDVAYTWHFDPGTLTISGDYAYRGTQDGQLFNRYYDNAPAWDDVDFRALWKGPNDKYEVIAYVKNVFNTLQYTVAAEGAGLSGSATAVANPASGLYEVNAFELNPPRTFGMEVRYKFF
jgi:iron complex outermembrane receptor protein